MAEDFLKLTTDTKSQNQEPQRTLDRLNTINK